MNIAVRAPLLFCAALAAASCAAPSGEEQIRSRLLTIRAAILAERVEGIFEFGTPDWTFVAPDGQQFDRAAYRARTEKLFASVDIESLETRVTRIDRRDERALVELTQTMVRVETTATGERQRWRVVYDERQEWRRSRDRGWLVARVEVVSPRRARLAP